MVVLHRAGAALPENLRIDQMAACVFPRPDAQVVGTVREMALGAPHRQQIFVIHPPAASRSWHLPGAGAIVVLEVLTGFDDMAAIDELDVERHRPGVDRTGRQARAEKGPLKSADAANGHGLL